MEDNEIREAIYQTLTIDWTLMEMVSKENVPWNSPEDGGYKSPDNSIVPMMAYDYSKMSMPIITIQIGDTVRNGFAYMETTIYIRCYNNSQKSHYDISAILDRVIELLHRVPIKLSKSRFVELTWQTTSADSEDEAYGLPYREARFILERV